MGALLVSKAALLKLCRLLICGVHAEHSQTVWLFSQLCRQPPRKVPTKSNAMRPMKAAQNRAIACSLSRGTYFCNSSCSVTLMLHIHEKRGVVACPRSLPCCLGLRRMTALNIGHSAARWVAGCPTGGSGPRADLGADLAAASAERSAACRTPAAARPAAPRTLPGLRPPAAASVCHFWAQASGNKVPLFRREGSDCKQGDSQ